MTNSNLVRRLASDIAAREGKKSQARIGDIREILGILADMMAAVPAEDLNTELDPVATLNQYGEDRKARGSRGKKKK